MRTTLLLAFIIGILSFQAPQQAHACSCAMPRSTQESIDETEVIFSGTVESVGASGEMQFGVTMTVDEDWKGLEASERSEVTVYTANNSAACGYAFEEGGEYLVYGYRDAETDVVRVGLCSATKPLDQADDDLALLSGEGTWACTMDAKQCPDGSYVGRQGPSCEFAACPGEVQACTKELKICPDGTGVGRTGPNCSFAPCPGEEESNCAPYVCANGTTHPRCSEDGHVINYFAAPCHMDGGEAAAFSDVPATHANAEAIAYVRAQGIVEGYADGTFKPDATINRAEFVKILMGSFEDDGRMCKIAAFSDVDQTAWYATYAHRARCQGVVDGYPDGTFKPANTINFVEAAKILSLAFDIAVPGLAEGDPWYKPYVVSLQRGNVIPTSITDFGQHITRGEMAEMVHRLFDDQGKPSKTYDELAARNDTVVFRNDEFPVTFSYPAQWSDDVRSDSSAPWYVYLGPTCPGCAEGTDAETMYLRAVDRDEALDNIADIRKQSQESFMYTTEHDAIVGGNRVFIWSSGGMCGFHEAYVIGERFAVSLGGFCLGDNAALSATLDAIAFSIRENPTFLGWGR